MKLVTPKQMAELDRRAIETYQVPSILLMEHAAYSVFTYINTHFNNKNIVIVCGPGNNGGDGFALARQLKIWSKNKVRVLMIASYEKLSPDGRTYYQLCEHAEIEVLQVVTQNKEQAYKELGEADIIVDALFGTGLSKDVEGMFADIIQHMNLSSAHIISIDIPSGINGETGKVQGVCVKADETITFVLPKVGLYLYPAVAYTGKIQVVDIGMPKRLIDEIKTPFYILGKEDMKQLLPQRFIRSNKGTYGKVLVIGGQTGMSGAVVLASQAALKSGAGTVTAAVPRSVCDIVDQKLTEVMTIPLQDENGHIAKNASKDIRSLIGKYDVVVLGPGIGRVKDIEAVLFEVLQSDKPCIIDADGLYHLRELLGILPLRKAPVIITPHPGEMARLTDLTVDQILDDPIGAANNFAKKNHVITVLKIERTIIADTESNIYISKCGNSGMAKGGSGDLLTGIIAGLLAQTGQPEAAAKLGVYLHGRSGDIMKALKTEYALLPTDLYDGFPQAFGELLKG